ncbi:MAG: MFS transporter [Planctomycetota bacterium]|nr:MFS transporter [Planctomycetota bacterium]MDW8372244.1 MFS transporter [Planctomycetota bacterium]
MPGPWSQPALRRALFFEAINACSWTAVLGAPCILLLKAQGASATVLGVALALMPLTQALQPLGARWLPRWGYRRTMTAGWRTRTYAVAAIALIAAGAPWLGAAWVVGLTLAALLVFTVIRGFTSCAWLPWITALVPSEVRGRYLAWASLVVQALTVLCGLGYAAVLAVLPGHLGFAVIFAWATAMGFAAAHALERIPDAAVEPEPPAGGVPWRAMLAHPPFARVLAFVLLTNLALAALGVLWVPTLRDVHQQSDSALALIPIWAALAQIAALPLIGPLVDRTGSKPVLAIAMLVWAAHAGLWSALAAGWLPLAWWSLALIQGTAGFAAAAHGVAGQSLLMASVPGQGRSHFFALHSLALAAGSGIAPVLWGLALDVTHGWQGPGGLNAHALWYAISAGLCGIGWALTPWLIEPHARSVAETMRALWSAPRRALARLGDWIVPGR